MSWSDLLGFALLMAAYAFYISLVIGYLFPKAVVEEWTDDNTLRRVELIIGEKI